MSELVPNLRDVGGLRNMHGRPINTGIVLRSGAPFPADAAHAHIQWPPSDVVDLRSTRELGPTHPLADHGAQVHQIPLLAALAPEANTIASLEDLYLQVLDTATHGLAQIVNVVADATGPTLIHCAAGKDRTGVAVGLILRLAGVDTDQVMADYLVTANYYAEIRKRLNVRIERGMATLLPRSFYDVSAPAMAAVLRRWDEHPHGVEGWTRDAGVSADTLQGLRERIIGN